jgi:hypothetical protein
VPSGTQVPGRSQKVFAYGTVTRSGRLSHTFLLTSWFFTPMCLVLQPSAGLPAEFGLFPVRSPLLGESFLFLWVLRCFSSPGSHHLPYRFRQRRVRFTYAGFPIRRSPDRRLYTAPRSFSQCPTSFIGICRLGIHHKLLVAYFRDKENSILFFLSSASFLSL